MTQIIELTHEEWKDLVRWVNRYVDTVMQKRMMQTTNKRLRRHKRDS